MERGRRTSYIIIDALDESDDAKREELMDMLQSLLALENLGIHVLVTGRTNTTGVEKKLHDLKRFYNIVIEREYVSLNILVHIIERLQNNKILKA